MLNSEPILRYFNECMINGQSISESKIIAFSQKLDGVRINDTHLKIFFENWIKRSKKFPSIPEILHGTNQIKSADISTKTGGDGCPHDICDGTGCVVMRLGRQEKLTSCTCQNEVKRSNVIATFTRLLKEGWLIDINDPYHRILVTGEVRKGVLEANKTMEKLIGETNWKNNSRR